MPESAPHSRTYPRWRDLWAILFGASNVIWRRQVEARMSKAKTRREIGVARAGSVASRRGWLVAFFGWTRKGRNLPCWQLLGPIRAGRIHDSVAGIA